MADAEKKRIQWDTPRIIKCKRYNELHREQINKRRGEKVVCECGAVIRIDYLAEHKKSIKHKENISKLQWQ